MKKLFTLWGLLAVALMAKAQDFSLKVDDITLEPGKFGYVTVTSTSDLSEYSAFQMDFVCPEGLIVPSFELDNETYFGIYNEESEEFYDAFVINGEGDNGIYYYNKLKKTYGHVMESNVLEGGRRARIVVYSGSNYKFRNGNTLEMKFLVKASDDAAGTYTVTVENPKFATDGGSSEVTSGFCPEVEAGTCTIATTITYELKADYGTLILPFAADLPEGLKAYSCAEVEGNVLTLVEAESLAANTPYIMGGAKGSYAFTGAPIPSDATLTAGLLTGVLEDTDAPAGSYVLQNNTNGLGFYKVGSVIPTVKAYRCYLTYAGEASALMYRFGGTTNISNIEAEGNNAMYDILGRKVVGPAQKGVYILNGKKVFVK